MAGEKVDCHALAEQAESSRAQGASVMYLASNAQLVRLIAVSDLVKPSTIKALAELKTTGMNVIMATGDSLTKAKSLGRNSVLLKSTVRRSRKTSCS